MRPGAAALVAVLLGVAPALGQGPLLHGADATFSGPGVAIAWGVLRAPAEEETRVVIRIVVRDRAYAYAAVDAVDPFSGARRTVLAGEPVAGMLDVWSPRETFAELPRREVRLYASADDWRAGRPALTVFYLGVPDTTPEFTSDAALRAHLAAAVERAR